MIDADELRRLKAVTAGALPGLYEESRRKHPRVYATDLRLAEYVAGCVGHPDDHNLYELLGIRHFFQKLDKYDWKERKAKRFIKFYELLRFSGLKGRRRYKLTPVQTFIFSNIYGLYRKDGRRLTRTAYLFVPRKFSKTTSVASMAVYDMLAGDENAQAFVGANSYDQAKICFDEIRNIMHDIDPQERSFRINREKITFKSGRRESFVRCLTGNAKTGDGLSASLAILDEYAQARDTPTKPGAALKNVLTSSMGARLDPLTVIMTTASEVLDGPFARELAGVKAVLRGETSSDSTFAILFEPDVDDREDDPHTWAKVQPHLGITVQADYYEQEWEEAQKSADNLMTFRTKLLNIFAVSEKTSWISRELIEKASCHLDLSKLRGRPEAMCAIDLSVRGDFSAVSFGIYDTTARSFQFRTDYFIPEGALPGHLNERLYRIWIEQGYLHAIPGEVIDYRAIVEFILEQNKYVTILRIGYDQWKATDVINMLSAAGAKNVLAPVKQTYGNFTAPVESFEHGLHTGHIFIDDNPINAFCFGNAVLDEDHLENKKPIKRQIAAKVDGVITMLMCMREFIDFER